MAHHVGNELEIGERADAIVRKAIADLRDLDPGCDCTVMWSVGVMLALALDERVISEDDAGQAIALVEFVGHMQADRRRRFGLDERTVDGPLDPRAEAEGDVVGSVAVVLDGQVTDVETAVGLFENGEDVR